MSEDMVAYLEAVKVLHKAADGSTEAVAALEEMQRRMMAMFRVQCTDEEYAELDSLAP
jgi:hypothetical protein